MSQKHTPATKKHLEKSGDYAKTAKSLKQVGMMVNGKMSPEDIEKFFKKGKAKNLTRK